MRHDNAGDFRAMRGENVVAAIAHKDTTLAWHVQTGDHAIDMIGVRLVNRERIAACNEREIAFESNSSKT